MEEVNAGDCFKKRGWSGKRKIRGGDWRGKWDLGRVHCCLCVKGVTCFKM